MRLSLIAAVGINKEIGYRGVLPWELKELKTDMDHFKSLTINHAVIMGRKTFESLNKKPLPHRTNIVVSRNPDYSPLNCLLATSFKHALRLIPSGESETFVTGGAEIYAVALAFVTRMYITHVDYAGPADTYFPDFNPDDWETVSEESHLASPTDQYSFRFSIYDRKSLRQDNNII